MMVIGLTGPTGAGKSSVCSMLSDWDGISVVDCDQVARNVVGKGKRCLLDLAVEFSPVIIQADGTLNRRRLAQLVFTDREKLKRLNAIIFPHIREEIEEDIAAARRRGARAVVLDAPTLFESGADRLCTTIVVVTAQPDTRLRRIMARDGIPQEEAQSRMNSQQPAQYYLSRAHHVLHNDEDSATLRLQVLELMNRLGL